MDDIAMGVDMMITFAVNGDVEGLRAAVQRVEERTPGFWQTTEGRLHLCIAVNNGIIDGRLSIVQYLCGERGVPAMGEYPQDEFAVTHRRTEIGMYLLTLVSPAEDLGRLLSMGFNLLHHAARSGEVPLSEALVQRGVDFDLRNERGVTPLAYAIRWSRMPLVRFLLEQYRARGRDEKEMLRDLLNGLPYNLILAVISESTTHKFPIPEEDRRATLAFLVREAGANIWAEILIPHSPCPCLPIHAAAYMGSQTLIDFFLTDCGMPIDACTSTAYFTVLDYLALAERTPETEILRIMRWLVEEKGANVMPSSTVGQSAARMAFNLGKLRMYEYLQAQEKQQTIRKAMEKEKQEAERKKLDEAKKKAAESAAQIRAAEEAMSALLLELEEEDAAEKQAAASKKKNAKASGSGKKKR